MEFVDLRSEKNRENERRAQWPLDSDDELISKELANLTIELRSLSRSQEEFTQKCTLIRKIGKFLCSNGGSDRMDLICYRVYFLCGSSYFVRRNWDGVCGWFY